MKPINVIQRLNEADNRTEIEEFAEKLNKLIQADGLDTMRNGDLLYVIKETENGKASMNVEFYEGWLNPADYEVNYIGLGGDTLGDITVSPLAKSGWEQENGDPRGTQFEDGHECWAESCPLSKTSPEEVAEIIKASFDAVDNKSESSLNESDETGEITKDEFLDSEITVYDLDSFIDKINDAQGINYRVHLGGERALLQGADGKYILADYEAVRDIVDNADDTITLELSSKPEKIENSDGTTTEKFSIVPSASVDVSINDIIENSKSKKMKARDFFSKYDYNDRCARNFDGMIDNLNGKHKGMNESAKLEESDKISSYYVISENDFNKLLELNGGAFENGYLAITKDEANELAKKQGLLINSMGVISGEED